MQVAVQFFDEDVGHGDGNRRVRANHLRLVAETLSAAEVITSRVREEWNAHESQQHSKPESRTTFVQRLTGDANLSAFDSVDAAIQTALQAFRGRQFLFFWNEHQVETLDERLSIRSDNEAVFLRLMPLQGG